MVAQKRTVILILLGILFGCGNGRDSDGGEAARDLSGSWRGDAVVTLERGASFCSFFAGQYPIDWTLAQSPNGSYTIADGGTVIASGTSDDGDPQTVRISFPDVQNRPPEISEVCIGSETVTLTETTNSTLSWEYEGVANCGNSGECQYSGSATLTKSP